MKRNLNSLLLMVTLACLQGCATYRLTIPDSRPDDINYRARTVHAFFWGSWYKPQALTADCGRGAINDVHVERSVLHDLASVTTFGVWMPMTLTFRCASAPIQEGPPIRPR